MLINTDHLIISMKKKAAQKFKTARYLFPEYSDRGHLALRAGVFEGPEPIQQLFRSLDQFPGFGDQKDSIRVQFLDLASQQRRLVFDLASQQGRLFFMLRTGDALRAVEQHMGWSPIGNYQIAQETGAPNGTRRRDV
jgi:hypothetical protein